MARPPDELVEQATPAPSLQATNNVAELIAAERALGEVLTHYQLKPGLRAHPIPAYFFMDSKYTIGAAEATVKARAKKAQVAKTPS